MTFRARAYLVGGVGGIVETIPRPVLAISAVHYADNGQLGFNLSGPIGEVAITESSPDLKAWTPQQTNTMGTTVLPFLDPRSDSASSRFYRLRSGP